MPAALAQQPATGQCSRAQLDLCGEALTSCSRHGRDLAARRDALTGEVATLRRSSGTCPGEPEPRWREIVRKAVDGKLLALRKPQVPAACEYMDFEIAANARVIIRARLPDTAPVVRAASELRTQLPGIEIDESDLKPVTNCVPETAGPGWGFEGGRAVTRQRDSLGERRRDLPPASECQAIGAHVDEKAPEPDRRAAAEGFWVIDDGLVALCRKGQGGTWSTERIVNDQPGVVIMRVTQ